MMSILKWKVSTVIVTFLPVVAMAADAPPTEFLTHHPETATWLLGIALVVIGFFIVKTMAMNEKAHEEMMREMKESRELQWKAISNLTNDIGALFSQHNHLKGEHDAIKDTHYHYHKRISDPDA